MPTLRRTARDWLGGGGVVGGALLAVGGLLLVAGIAGAVFSSTTAAPSSTLSATSLDDWLPTAVSATRTATTTCLVSWTPAAGAPAGLTYDVTDGAATVVTGASGTSASATVSTAAVTPTVRARLGTWLSASATTAAAACNGWPDAPGDLALTPSDGTVAATWTAPGGNGGTVASYTAVISPAPGSDPATCTVTAPTTTCSWSSLTNGVEYTVSVTATSDVGTGPATDAATVPYPSAVMSASDLVLWLDGADTSTLLASSSCTGAAATTTLGCWADKSVSGNDAVQSASGNRATLGSLNGHDAVLLDGTDDHYDLTVGLLPTGTTASAIYTVAVQEDPSPATSGLRHVIAWGAAGTDQGRAVHKGASTANAYLETYGTWSSMSPTGQWATSAATLFDGVVTASGVTATVDGAASYSYATSPNTGTSAGARLGSSPWAGEYWQGRIAEVVVLAADPSAAESRQVRDYLATKWGVTLVPDAPTGVSGSATTPSSTDATVGWTAPDSDGGSAVTSYTATAVPVAGGPTVTCGATPPTTTCTLTGLAGGGAQYDVTVTATNAAGEGPASSSATVFSGVPSGTGAKLWLAADDLDGDGLQESSAEDGLVSGAVDSWQDKSGGGHLVSAPSSAERPAYDARTLNGYAVPTFDGSTVLLGSGTDPYGITGDRSLFVVTRERSVTSGSAGDSLGSFLIDSDGGSSPRFSLRVCSSQWALQHRNDAGTSSGCLDGGSAPSAGEVRVVTGQRSGSTVSARVSGSPGSTDTSSGTLTQPPVAVGRHATATTSQDLDIAEVLLYDSHLSGSDRRAVENYLVAKWGAGLAPDAPTGISASATGSSGEASVSWTAPTDVGTSALTQYTASTTSGGFSCTATPPTTSCTLTGLTDGTTYTVSVQAGNTIGTGDASSTTTVTPVTLPGAPTAVAATADDTTSSVSWTAPAADGGSAITGYTATAVPSDGTLPTVQCTDATGPCSLTGLTNGITYTVTVTATNAVGTGPASTATTVIPYPASVMSASNLALWLDGADTSTMFVSSACTGTAATTDGQSVGCWLDKSANATQVTQGTAGEQPVLTTSGGRPVPGFDGVDDGLTFDASALPTAEGDALQAVAATLTDASTDSGTVLSYGSGAGGMRRMLHSTTTSTIRVDTGGAASGVEYGAWSATDPTVLLAPFTASFFAAYPNGTVGDYSLDSFTTTGTAGAVGRTAGTTTQAWAGPVHEVIVLSVLPTDDDMRLIEEYLARKWGTSITPAAPQNLVVTPGAAGTATMSWSAPAWDGGASVTSYTALSYSGGSCVVTGTTASCTGLPAGLQTFAVNATNSVGGWRVAFADATIS